MLSSYKQEQVLHSGQEFTKEVVGGAWPKNDGNFPLRTTENNEIYVSATSSVRVQTLFL